MVFSYYISVSNDDFVVFFHIISAFRMTIFVVVLYYIGVSNYDFVVFSYYIGVSNDERGSYASYVLDLFI